MLLWELCENKSDNNKSMSYAAAQRREIQPNQTIYIKNLNEKIRKNELRRLLYYLFSQFGPILDVVALKTAKMRGQAFVVFKDPITASNAMRECQNMIFMDKPMVINYAKTQSYAIKRILDPSFDPAAEQEKERSFKRKAEEAPANQPPPKQQNTGQSVPLNNPVPPPPSGPPNKTLFIQNLPASCTEPILVSLFQSQAGFQEVRIVPGQKGMAFVDFGNETQAGYAMQELQGFRVEHENPMMITYKKL